MQGQDTASEGVRRLPRLAAVYEAARALLEREGWRGALVRQIAPAPHDIILDGFCGAGALSLALARIEPRADIVGLDPRPGLVRQARARAVETGLRVSFIEGAPRDAAVWLGQRTPTQIVLKLGDIASAPERLAHLQGARQIVDPAGLLHVADSGPRSADTATLIRAAGFVAVEETATWAGAASLFRARAS